LLPEPEKPYGGIRRYAAKDVARVRFVKAAQRLGFSLDEVAGLADSWTTARTVTRRDSSPKQSSAMCARS
jgi:DNA-binding transcriptional MerR regulator